MAMKSIIDEALSRGKKIKEELVSEVLNAQVLNQMFQSDVFVRAVTTVIKTKEDVSRAIRSNVQHMFDVMDIPTRSDLKKIESKLSALEKNLEKSKRTIAIKTLKKTR